MALTGAVHLTGHDIFNPSADKKHPYGAVGVDKYGDVYRYAKLSADTSAGYLLTGLAREANHQNIALSAAAAVGDKVILPTVGATAVDANEYDEGWWAFTDVSPEGEAYRITSHNASTGSEAVRFNLERKLLTAATTSSEGALVRNPWNNCAVSQLIAEPACGVTLVDVDVSEKPYAWLKTRGVAPVLVDTAGVTVGLKVTISDQVNGAVGLYSDVDAEMVVGQAMQTGTATEFNPINLCID